MRPDIQRITVRPLYFSCPENVYLDCMVPAVELLGEAWVADPWSEPDMTEVQVILALCGLAELEILNGGVKQMILNRPDLAPHTPEAFRRMGWSPEAAKLERAISLAKPGPVFALRWLLSWLRHPFDPARRRGRLISDFFEDQPAELLRIEQEIADLLQRPDFHTALEARARADQEGFVFP